LRTGCTQALGVTASLGAAGLRTVGVVTTMQVVIGF
jgi:hypothetical protein